ncbi:anti-sigma factor [Robertmurraya massiliosenegalensis]|uniref:anti-sigma factor n=1 Tax=Robertmurraya massiliosenegalensis TaxID=1287657 RepID=UPI0002D86828|nr:anti-sigma factor [Robertmurraya massiliosenegalensis]
MDKYKKLIRGSKNNMEESTASVDFHKSVKRSLFESKWKMILASLTTILMIIPLSYLFTLMYYSFGTTSVTLMDVVSKTLYVTEPNTSLEELEFDMNIKPFSLELAFEQYKRIGEEDYKANTYDLRFAFAKLLKKEVDSNLERLSDKYPTETNPWLIHPENLNEIDSSREWKVLEGLPDETVVEAYLSFNKLMPIAEAIELMPDVDVMWAAVDTGVEAKNLSADGSVVSPIGFPIQRDDTYWSPFRDASSNEEVFREILHFLTEFEEMATEVSSAKNLKLDERIDYIESNGIQTYAVVVTGPKNSIEQLKSIDTMRSMKIGEVKLWNWSR